MSFADLPPAADHFALLQLPRQQALDPDLLDRNFRELQARVHPDRHAHAGAADQRLAMQWATRVNEAYQTLKSPLARARYLLGLLGHEVQAESNTAMPVDFLMAQMELREAVEDAKLGADGTALDAFIRQIDDEIRAQQAELTNLIDQRRDYAGAVAQVRQLMFQEKLRAEIEDALDAVLD
jgi:molecular chaperone HscB